MDKREEIIEGLEGLSAELCFEEFESGKAIIDVVETILEYFENGDEVFEDNEINNLGELISTVKGLIDELECDNYDRDIIQLFRDTLAELNN